MSWTFNSDWAGGLETIPIKDCLDGWLYKIDARNTWYGIWSAEHQGFFYLRKKFTSRFIDMEFHWETGEPYGTASPKLPIEFYKSMVGVQKWMAKGHCTDKEVKDRKDMFDYLDKKMEEFNYESE